jgi:phage tail-like protein
LSDSRFREFSFLVDIGTAGDGGPQAGFRECSGLGLEVSVVEFRAGNEKERAVRKIPPPAEPADVTLKHGLIAAADFYGWLKQLRGGDQAALRTVRVALANEDGSEVVQAWRLINARIVKFVPGPVDAKGTDVAMEELTLAYERLEVD